MCSHDVPESFPPADWCSEQLYDSICDEGAYVDWACEAFSLFFSSGLYIALADFVLVASLAREELEK